MGKKTQNQEEESPKEWMKRVIEAAEVIIRADGFQLNEHSSANAGSEKHKSVDLLYRRDQYS